MGAKIAILLMGGKGERFGDLLPKQFHKIGGKSVYLHTLETFLSEPFDLIILTVPKQWESLVKQDTLCYKDRVVVTLGGSTRQESSYLSLLACPETTSFVSIHDAVRPFISKNILRLHQEALLHHQAIDTCIPTADTIVRSYEGEFIDEIPPRHELLRGQTPQSFSFPLILAAHKKALEDGIQNSVDDCSLVKRLGAPVFIVKGEDRNIKITSDLDLFIAEQLLYLSTVSNIPHPPSSLEGKVFAVTGATGGIGSAICEQLKNLGAVPLELSLSSMSYPIDATKHQDVEDLFNKIYETYGKIDGLINSVGSFEVKPFEHLSSHDITQTLECNLNSVIYCCKHAQIKQGGHIINISSSSYSKGRKDYVIYSAAKAAVVNFTQGLAEAFPTLHVNVVVPQRTNTQLRKSSFPEEDEDSLLDPQEIAYKIASLLQTKVTGNIIPIKKYYTLK